MIIERKILLEELINREYPKIRSGIDTNATFDGCPIPPTPIFVEDYVDQNPKYGKIDKSFIYIPIMLQQTLDDMGIFSNESFIPSENVVNNPIDYFKRITELPLENYFQMEEYVVSGYTDSKLDSVTSYSKTNPYMVGFNMSQDISNIFDGVLSFSDTSVVYVLGGQVDEQGKYVDGTGVKYETFFGRLNSREDCGFSKEYLYTTFQYKTKGVRDYNSVLMAIIKEDKYLGVVFEPTIDDDVFVDRGTVNVLERHLRLSEIDSVEQMQKYSNGFFNVSFT